MFSTLLIKAFGLPGVESLVQLGLRNRRSFPTCRPLIPVSLGSLRNLPPCRMHSTIRELFYGNLEYIAKMSHEHPGLLRTLAKEGQRPPFMLIDCSDSRVNEQEIFSAQPGTLFTTGNIANRFDDEDLNSNAALSFAVGTLNVKHVIVLGHYGCGGVAASMVQHNAQAGSPPDGAVQKWIAPIREVYATSTREEIVSHRERSTMEASTVLPDLHDPAFRALVEENVKSNVAKIAASAVMRNNYDKDVTTTSTPAGMSCKFKEIYIHGWVYDVEDGKVSDLGITVGPPGMEVPPSPFPLVNPRLDSEFNPS